jgi:DNA polymerase-3 subunit epsilon
MNFEIRQKNNRMTTSFASIDLEIANGYRTSVCSVGIAIVRNNEIVEKIYRLIRP